MEGRIEGIKITHIGGGSRGWAWQLMSDLAKEEQLNGAVKLYDIDYDAVLHNMAIGNGLKVREDARELLNEMLSNTASYLEGWEI